MTFKQFCCFHKLVEGAGCMGDALTCVKCGVSKYPEAMPHLFLYYLLFRVRDLEEDEMFSNDFPYVRKKTKEDEIEIFDNCEWIRQYLEMLEEKQNA